MVYDTPYGIVDFPIFTENVGISLSGGADSTIVLYILVLNGVIPRVFFIDKTNSKIAAAMACVSFINDKFGTNLELEIVNRYVIAHNLRPDIERLSSMVSYLYTGVTQNPPISFDNTLAPNRPNIRQVFIGKYVMPFIALDKRASIFLYTYFGVLELLDITFTCTLNSNVEPPRPCTKCFACRERDWATGEIDNAT